ncbi:MAG: hypothetical protein ACOC8C_02045, partial [Chloroflexota bacterium]
RRGETEQPFHRTLSLRGAAAIPLDHVMARTSNHSTAPCHCEERSDEAISPMPNVEIASLRSR